MVWLTCDVNKKLERNLCHYVYSQDLGVNSLEQLCINFANEHLHQFISQIIITQEEVK